MNRPALSFLLLWAVLCSTAAGKKAGVGRGDLKFVVVLYRHGDRTPIDMYPNDPYKDPSNWPVGFGQLTPRGKQMQFQLGKYLRQRYGELLGDEYSEKVIYVRSTDVDRTLMSAQSNLAGLYPPKGNQVWNKQLAWQPIPVHTMPVEEDSLLTNHAKCPRFEAMLEQLLESEEVRKINQDNAWLFEYLTEHSGMNITDMMKVNFLYDTLFIETVYNKTLPAWTDSVYPDKMSFLRGLAFTLTTWNHEMKRLRVGPLLKNLVEVFRQVESGEMDPPERRMIMYSGHDTTLSSLLNGLGVYNRATPPPYASLVAAELRQDGGKYFVELSYRNDSARDPYVLTLPGCEESCPLDKFDNLTRSLRPSDWRGECGLDSDPTARVVTEISIGVGAALLLTLVAAVAVRCVRRRSSSSPEGEGYASLNQDMA